VLVLTPAASQTGDHLGQRRVQHPRPGSAFNVVVQSQDNGGTPRIVTVDTAVSLSLNTGNGSLGGTLTGLIPAGANAATITGVTYTKAESSVVLTASGPAAKTLRPETAARSR
jgi:hypothetical protein